jgi:hypothetical protein
VNTISGSTCESFIGGGVSNVITACRTVIVGGNDNTVTGCRSAIVGGRFNCLMGENSFIGGGECNSDAGLCNVHIIGSNITGTTGCTTFVNNLCVFGSITKGSGTFSISHPNPLKTCTHKLIHSFVESPTAGDNIYRYEVDVNDGVAIINLPEYYQYLNENSQIWVSPKNGFGMGYGIISDDQQMITIFADKDLTYNVLIIGTRKDEIAKKQWKGVEVEKNDIEKRIEL